MVVTYKFAAQVSRLAILGTMLKLARKKGERR
jgi:hypothetical protein